MKHYLIFDDDLVKEYMEFSNEGKPTLIAQFNATISDRKIEIYYPSDKNQIISKILIDENDKLSSNKSLLICQ